MVEKVINTFRCFVAIILIGVILLITSGFKLYGHHCSHKNVANYSILIPAESCAVIEKVDCCCEADSNNCSANCCSNKQQFSRYEIESFFSSIGVGYENVKVLFFSTILPNVTTPLISFNVNVLWQLVVEPPPTPLNRFLSVVQVYLN